MNTLREGLSRYFSPTELHKIRSCCVGIAGAGGLGSNVAMLLARCGFEQMLLIDYDRVEPSNLNRQLFWPRHVGMLKVQAVAELLFELNPALHLQLYSEALDKDNIKEIIGRCPLWVEALDRAEAKALLVEEALAAGCYIASASGLAGYGQAPMQKRCLGKLTVVGDFVSDIAFKPPLAPRVAEAAALLADVILQTVLTCNVKNGSPNTCKQP